MKICPQCGKSLDDRAIQCPKCKASINTQNFQQQPPNYQQPPPNYQQPQQPAYQPQPTNAVHCPRCGGTNLQAISDTSGKGASFWKICFCGLLGLCGTGKTRTDHYWVCSSCGNKFRM